MSLLATGVLVLQWPSLGQGTPVVRIQAGDVYRVVSTSSVSGQLTLPDPKTGRHRQLAIRGTTRVVYRERAIRVDNASAAARLLRVYEGVEYQRTVGDQSQQVTLRAAVRRVVLDSQDTDHFPFSPDGPLQWSEIKLIRGHAMLPVLEGLLPSGDLQTEKAWNATDAAARDLTGLLELQAGTLACAPKGTIEHQGKRLQRISVSGTLVGRTNEGRTRDRVNAAVYLDAASQRLDSLRAIGDREILGANDKVTGTLAIDYQIVVTRLQNDPELSGEAADAFAGTPTQAQADVLYENPNLGVLLVHPRVWQLVAVQENRMLFDTRGNTLTVHREAVGQVPTTQSYFEEVKKYLESAETTIAATTKVRERSSDIGRIGNFRIDVIMAGQPMVLDYWVVARDDQGASLSARIHEPDAERLLPGIERIAYNIQFSRPRQSIGPAQRRAIPGPTGAP